MKSQKAPNLWLAETLWEIGAIHLGDFTLGRTTLHSPIYINLRLLISHPQTLRRVARIIKDEVRALQSMRHPQIAPFDLVAGIPIGGLLLATAYSLQSGTPLLYIHPTKGSDRGGRLIEGLYRRSQRVLLIDDLCTSGTSLLETAVDLALAGLQVRDCIVLIDRQEGARERLRRHGYNLVAILGLETLLNYLMANGKIDEEWYRRCIDYIHSRRPTPEGEA